MTIYAYNMSPHLLTVVCIFATGDLNAAISVATEGLKFVPDEPSLYFCLANVLGKMERYEVGLKKYLA